MESLTAAAIGLALGLAVSVARIRLAPRKAFLFAAVLAVCAFGAMVIAEPGSTAMISGLVGIMVGVVVAGGLALKPQAS